MTQADTELVVVLGMHRSGTSLLAEALYAAGFAVADNLLEADPDINPRGFWEDADVVQINDQILEKLGCSWHSLRTLPPDWTSNPDLMQLRKQAQALVADRYCAGKMVLKDPRLTRLWPFWQELFDEQDCSPAIMVMNREPLAVARSLQARNGLSLDYGLLLWARHMLDIRDTLPASGWAVVNYDDLLAKPEQEISTALSRLNISQTIDASAVQAVADPALRHSHKGSDTDVDQQLLDSCNTLFDSLNNCDTFLQADFSILDDVRTVAILSSLAEGLIDKYSRQVEIGGEHAIALQTLRSRDQQLQETRTELEALGTSHGKALATITERDEQLQQVNAQLAKTGQELEHAQAVVKERDAEIGTLQHLLGLVRDNPVGRLLLKFIERKN